MNREIKDMTMLEFLKWLKVYLLGDMLKQGNQIMRIKEAKILRDEGLEVYSALEQKDINDKTNQTVESNNNLAERIYAKDMKAIRESEVIIADIDNDSIGSICEIGAIGEHNHIYEELEKILEKGNVEENLRGWMKKYPKKKVFFHNTDIRNTEIPEQGMRRSYSINAFLYGLILAINKQGFESSFDVCVKKAKEYLMEKFTKLKGEKK